MRTPYGISRLSAAVVLAVIALTATHAQSRRNLEQGRIAAPSAVPASAPPVAVKRDCEESYLDPPVYKDGRWWFCGRAYAERPDYRAKRGWTAQRGVTQ